MSFASEVKHDLCEIKRKYKRCCTLMEGCGILLFCNIFNKQEIKIVTENRQVAKYITRVLLHTFSVKTEFSESKRKGILVCRITEEKNLLKIFKKLQDGIFDGVSLRIPFNEINECCKAAFIRGAFLSAGTISNPNKGYHLEFTTPHYKLSNDFAALLGKAGLNAKVTMRKSHYVVYFKDSESIEDILSIMGAQGAALRLMEVKVEKDFRSQINRQVNCETANISKTAEAAVRHMAAIEELSQHIGLDNLPDNLKEIAELRMKYPEATLKELGERLVPPISRSGVNHRLCRLVSLANEIKDKKETDND